MNVRNIKIGYIKEIQQLVDKIIVVRSGRQVACIAFFYKNE